MRTIVAAALLCLVIALMLPLLFAGGGQAAPETSAEPESAAGGLDSELSFTVLTADGVETVTMSDWLPGVVAGEMPALFEEEALKAQAVAARTYIMYSMGREKPAHPEADVCDDPACCKAHSTDEELREKWGESYEENMARVLEAVRSTDGEYMSYGGEVIQAVFHSSSAGRTEDSAAIWQAEPYLVSVESPETAEDVPNYVTSVTVSPEDFREAVLTVHPEAEFGEDPAFWLGAAVRDASGRVESVDIGGTQVPGTELRTIFKLRSTAFTLDYTAEGFLFTVTGYGHGVGMSQYGANVMAEDGADYEEILTHYYPGAELTRAT